MSDLQRRLVELAVIGVSAGGTGSVIALGAMKVADVGDLLGFVGAAVGAFLTIGGAVWIEDRRQSAGVDRERRLIRAALTDLRTMLEPVAADAPFDADQNFDKTRILDMDALKAEIVDHIQRIDDRIELLDLALDSARIDRFEDLAALQKLRRHLAEVRPIVEREGHVVSGNRAAKGIIEIYYRKMQPTAEAAITAIEDALTVLRQRPD